jgi:hypothetical protein
MLSNKDHLYENYDMKLSGNKQSRVEKKNASFPDAPKASVLSHFPVFLMPQTQKSGNVHQDYSTLWH